MPRKPIYDLGGEGVAHHDTNAVNQGVDISYTRDFADFNHTNLFDPPQN